MFLLICCKDNIGGLKVKANKSNKTNCQTNTINRLMDDSFSYSLLNIQFISNAYGNNIQQLCHSDYFISGSIQLSPIFAKLKMMLPFFYLFKTNNLILN